MPNHGPINLETFVDPMFQENGLLVWRRPGGGRGDGRGDVRGGGEASAWIVDPGFPPQPDELVSRLNELKLHLAAILLTHCHVDHIAGIERVREAFPGATIIAPAAEADMLGDAWLNLSAPAGVPVTAPEADKLLKPGETIELDDVSWRVLDVAGHSPGGLAYYCEAAGIAIVGDSLFNGSIGRYDFPGSSGELLLNNIRANLLSLPAETIVYPGHGPRSTIGHEKRSNPYLEPGFQP